MTRVDDDGVAALLRAAGRTSSARADVLDEGVDPALSDAVDVLRDAVVELDVVVAGSSRLVHRIWVRPDLAALVLGVRPGAHQVLLVPPAHLAAALVRLTRLRPRRTTERAVRPYPRDELARLVDPDEEVRLAALEKADAAWAWRLGVSWADDRNEVTAVDGPDGLFLAEADALLPITNTTAYRILATVLPPEALAPVGA